MKKGLGPTKSASALAHEGREGGIDLAAGAGVEDLNLQPDSASSRLHVLSVISVSASVGWIDEHGDTSGRGHQLTQQLQPLLPSTHR